MVFFHKSLQRYLVKKRLKSVRKEIKIAQDYNGGFSFDFLFKRVGGILGKAAVGAVGLAISANFLLPSGFGQHYLEKIVAREFYNWGYLPHISDTLPMYSHSAKILDRNNEVIWNSGIKEFRKDIKPHVLYSILLIEDKNYMKMPWSGYFNHDGCDLPSIPLGAYSTYVKKIRRGSSTIPMQNAKNLLGNADERNDLNKWDLIKCKIMESGISYVLTEKFGRLENVKYYYNNVYMGRGIYGLPAASEFYLGKDIDDTTQEEALLLSTFFACPAVRQKIVYKIKDGANLFDSSDFNKNYKWHGKQMLTKVNNALNILFSCGLIKEESIVDEEDIRAMGFKDLDLNPYGTELWTARFAQKQISSKEFEKNGRIISGEKLLCNEPGDYIFPTSLDIGLTRISRKAINSVLDSNLYQRNFRKTNEKNDNWKEDFRYRIENGLGNSYDFNFESFMKYANKQINGSVVILDSEGDIMVYVGGRNISTDKTFYDVLKEKVMVGSTIKPFNLYYNMASTGSNLSTICIDKPIEWRWDPKLKRRRGYPKNWDGKTNRKLTLLDQIIGSVNCPNSWMHRNKTIREALLRGFRSAKIDFSERDFKYWPSFIGSTDLNPLQLVGLFSAFEDGWYKYPETLQSFDDLDYNGISYNKDNNKVFLFDNEFALKETKFALRMVCKYGGGKSMAPEFPYYLGLVYGKTGTGNNQFNSLFLSSFNPYFNREGHEDKTITVLSQIYTINGGKIRVAYSTQGPTLISGKIFNNLFNKELDRVISDVKEKYIRSNPSFKKDIYKNAKAKESLEYILNGNLKQRIIIDGKRKTIKTPIRSFVYGVDGFSSLYKSILENELYEKPKELKILLEYLKEQSKKVWRTDEFKGGYYYKPGLN